MTQFNRTQQWVWNCIASFILLVITYSTSHGFAQALDTAKLDQLLHSLQQRDEAMGSLTLMKNGKVLYSRAIGHRYTSANEKIPANIYTMYRIASITKIFTATMIFQLIEENKISLQTTLDVYFPQMPNAKTITIRHMLSHRSGLRDFTQIDSMPAWIEKLPHREKMLTTISTYPVDFQPGERFSYSNSNYVLLGYIIEKIDGQSYESALQKRICAKLGLIQTHEVDRTPNKKENESFSYRFIDTWTHQPECKMPEGAGGIISTPIELVKFMDGLFTGKLLTKESLSAMTTLVDGFYGMGMHLIATEDRGGIGHGGDIDASQSMLVYFPKDSLTLAYCTNGIVYSKENIINHVLRIYDKQPFGISSNRYMLASIMAIIAVIGIVLMKFNLKTACRQQVYMLIGPAIPAIYWLSTGISGYLYGNYNYLKDPPFLLNSFYSRSGDFMSAAKLLTAFLLAYFLMYAYTLCKKAHLSIFPLLPNIFVIISMIGVVLFAESHRLNPLFGNLIIPAVLSPLLSLIYWRKNFPAHAKWISSLSLLLMILPLVLIMQRSTFAELVHNYFGLLISIFYLGWSVWIISVSFSLVTAAKSRQVVVY